MTANQQSVLYLSASKETFWLVVEPWANEFEIRPSQRCRLVAKNPKLMPRFEVEQEEGKLYAYVSEPGSTFEFWRDDKLELDMPVPIPDTSTT